MENKTYLNNVRPDGVFKDDVFFTVEELMDIYDSLPAEFRKVLREAEQNITTTKEGAERLIKADPKMYRKLIEIKMKESSLATYGPNHPNAK